MFFLFRQPLIVDPKTQTEVSAFRLGVMGSSLNRAVFIFGKRCSAVKFTGAWPRRIGVSINTALTAVGSLSSEDLLPDKKYSTLHGHERFTTPG